ncbi:MAG: CPBP family intramembrane metalloprotease [Chloroflexi bacterium]|nr:CPBP family intramembrane metalloprotease [Chloroflexota bacterium]
MMARAGGRAETPAERGEPRTFSAEERLLRDLLIVVRILAALFAYLGVLSGLAIALFLLGAFVVPGAREGPLALLGLGVAEGGAMAAVLLIWHKIDRQRLAALGLAGPRPRARRQWLRGAAIGGLMMGVVVLGWYTLVDGATWSTNPDAGRATIALVVGLVGFVVQGPSEEVLFRGYILENVRRRWGVAWAIGVSALAFAVMHAFNASFGLLPFINLVLFGVATAVYRLGVDGGQLWGVFAIHTVWNWLQQVVFGLPNSGNASVSANTLFSVQPNMALPDAMWGGGFGPEGTLATTLVLIGLIAAVTRLERATPAR